MPQGLFIFSHIGEISPNLVTLFLLLNFDFHLTDFWILPEIKINALLKMFSKCLKNIVYFKNFLLTITAPSPAAAGVNHETMTKHFSKKSGNPIPMKYDQIQISISY